MKKVLILGAGFGGIEAAIRLRKEKYDVTIVSDRDYFFINPTSIWIPTHEMEFKDVSIDLRELESAHGFKIVVDEVKEIKTADNLVRLGSGAEISDYDYLIVAMGAQKLKPKGVEHTLSICGVPTMSLEIRDRLDELVTAGAGKLAFGFGGNPKDSSSVRGGPAFELMFNVHNYLKKKKIRENFEISFFAPMAQPGARMGNQALAMLDAMLKKTKINKYLGKKIKSFEPGSVVFEDDSRLESDLIMFIPAGDGHTVVKSSDLPLSDAGFITINDYCEVQFNGEGPDNVFAVGDAAALEGPDWRAKQGHVAEVMGKNAAFNIIARDKGLFERKGYQEHLNILCVMDTGDGAGFVYRDDKKAFMLPMPVVGHWLKKGWGTYAKLSKLGKIPRIPGM